MNNSLNSFNDVLFYPYKCFSLYWWEKKKKYLISFLIWLLRNKLVPLVISSFVILTAGPDCRLANDHISTHRQLLTNNILHKNQHITSGGEQRFRSRSFTALIRRFMSNPRSYSLRSHQPGAIIEQPQSPARHPDTPRPKSPSSHLVSEDQSPVHQPPIEDSEEQEIGIMNSHIQLDSFKGQSEDPAKWFSYFEKYAV